MMENNTVENETDVNTEDQPIEGGDEQQIQENEQNEQEESREDDKREENPENEPFPKKAVNALSRRDKMIKKLRAEQQKLMEELESLKSAKPEADVEAPKEDDFETYGDYLKAVIQHETKNGLAKTQYEQQQKYLEQQRQQHEQLIQQERIERVYEQSQEFAKQVPDYNQVLEQNLATVDSFPPEIENLFYEIDNAPLAFYTLAKEGRLETLSTMSPVMAAVEIGRALDRGKTSISKRNVTNAPSPMSGVSGKGDAVKSPTEMSPDELMKWVGS